MCYSLRSRQGLATQNQMAFIDRIQKDLTEAMKLKDELRLSVLRMVKTALKNKESRRSARSMTPSRFRFCRLW